PRHLWHNSPRGELCQRWRGGASIGFAARAPRFVAGIIAGHVSRYPRPMEQSHLSRDAHERLSQELAERTTSRRREISHRIEEAREHGDIKENADYDAAKNEQGHNEARIRQIEAILRDAVIVERGNADVV